MIIVYLGLFVGAGLLIDWAVFDRIMTSGEVLWSVKQGYSFRDTLFPRIVVTVMSSAVIAKVALGPTASWVLMVGIIGFVGSLLYAVVSTTLRQRRFDA